MNHSILLVAGLALVTSSVALALQGASEPVKSAPEYFVTGAGTSAHLWVREGLKLRAIAHGECKECASAALEHGHEHK